MKDLAKLAKRFLNELHSEGTNNTIETLTYLNEQLENKHDPDPIEIKLSANINDFIERLKILESNLRSYVKDKNIKSYSNKLSELIEKTSYDGNRLFID